MGIGGGADPWGGALPVLREAAAVVAGAPCWQLSDTGVLATLAELDGVAARLAAARLSLVAEADGRGLADAAGATGAGALLRERLRMRPSDANAEVRLSRGLAQHPAVRDALADGRIGREHARTVVGVLRRLPRDTPEATVAEVTGRLLAEARRFDPSDLARIGRHILAHLDPDGPEPADLERRNRARREFSWNEQDDGTYRLWGRLDGEGAAALVAALDPLSAPRPADGPEGVDPRTPAQRRADALVTLAQHALDGGTLSEAGGERPHVTVTVPLGALTDGLGTAVLDVAGPVGPETARRLACDAGVVPVVLGSAGQPLDVGRATRTVPTGLRRALVARDHGCAFPGCDRPPTWTDAHHITHWANGGKTSLDNLVLVCRHHHRRIHHHGWNVRIATHGHPEFAPPGSHAYRRPDKPHHTRPETPPDTWRHRPRP